MGCPVHLPHRRTHTMIYFSQETALGHPLIPVQTPFKGKIRVDPWASIISSLITTVLLPRVDLHHNKGLVLHLYRRRVPCRIHHRNNHIHPIRLGRIQYLRQVVQPLYHHQFTQCLWHHRLHPFLLHPLHKYSISQSL